MAKTFKVKGVYHAEMYYYDPAKDARVRVRRSTGIKVDGSREAEKRARVTAGELEKALVAPATRLVNRRTLGDALDAREKALQVRKASDSSLAIHRCARAHVSSKLGLKTPCRKLSDEDLLNFAAAMLAEGLATDTARRYMVELRTGMKLVGANVPSAPDLGARVFRDEALTADEVRRICAELKPERARVVQLVFQTACRRREVYKLRRIAPGVGRLEGKTGLKTGERTIPLTPLADQILQDGPLKPWSNAFPGLVAAARRAGVRGANWNAIRAGAATTLLRAGVAPAVIAALLGHKTTDMVMKRYAKLKNLKVTVEDLKALSPGG